MKKYSKDREVISKLSPEQYRVTQKSHTERPGSGAYLHNAWRDGHRSALSPWR